MEIILSIFATVFVLLSVGVGVLLGFVRGYKRSIIHLGGCVISAILAYIIAGPISRLVLNSNTIGKIISGTNINSVYTDLINVSPSLEKLIDVFPAAIITPIIFLFLFVILNLLMKIPCSIVSKFWGEKDENLKYVGLPIGAVHGLIFAFAFVIVISGFVSITDNVSTAVLNDATVSEEITESAETVDYYVELVKKDPAIKIFCKKTNNLPSKNSSNNIAFIYNDASTHSTTKINNLFVGLTKFKINGEKLSVGEELLDITNTAICVIQIADNNQSANLTVLIKNLAESIKDSELLIQISPEVISALSKNWSNQEPFMGIECPSLDPTVEPLINSLLKSLSQTTPETLTEDIDTIIEIIDILDEHDMVHQLFEKIDSENLIAILNEDFLKELLLSISGNNRFCILIPEITNVGLRALSTMLNLPENNDEIYYNILKDISISISDILSKEVTDESISQLSNDLKTTLDKNGVDISKESADIISEAIIVNFMSYSSVSEEDVQKFFQEFAVVYSAIENKNSNQVQNDRTTVNLSETAADSSEIQTYDIASMNYNDKLSILASLGIYDHYNSMYDLSDPSKVMASGITAEEFVDTILNIVNAINENYDKISEMGNAAENPLASLSSSETLKTSKITAESIIVDSSSRFSEEEISELSSCIGYIAQFIESYSNIEGEVNMENIDKLDMAAAGQALDSLKKISSLSESVDKISNAVVSEVVGSNVNLSEKMNSNETSYKDLFTTVQATAQVVNNINNQNVTNELKEQDIFVLLTTLTPGTANVVTDIVNEDLLKSYGVPEEIIDASIKALRVTFIEMANLTGEEHDNEAKYIMLLLDLSILANTSTDADNIIGENGIFKSEEELVNMTIMSKVAGATLKALTIDDNGDPVYDSLSISEKISESNKANVVLYFEDIYNESKETMTAEELNELETKINYISYLLKVEFDFLNK